MKRLLAVLRAIDAYGWYSITNDLRRPPPEYTDREVLRRHLGAMALAVLLVLTIVVLAGNTHTG